MNKSTSKILSILLLFMASASWTGARADGGFGETKNGWSFDNGNGLYFFIDSEAGTAVLTNSEMKSEGSTKGANSYSGNIDIPETVIFNGNIYPVVGIQEYAFYNSTGLRTVAIPAYITSIGSEAFSGCTGLEAITVDNQNPQYASISGLLLSKNQKTLLYCPGGMSGECVVPTKVTAIANNAFLNCSNLTSVVLPDGVTSIGESAFQGCSSLASINMPASLTTIGDNAFYEARALSSKIVIPSGVLTIGASAFQFCTSLNNVVLSEGINEIKNNAFRNCTSLQSIQLPNTINSIGTYAFAYTGLTSIIIPASITEIKSGTFEGAKLTYVSLPENLTAIKNKAFYNNGTTISTLNIPASVTSIGDLAFDKTTINDIYVNNTPRHLQISASTPFNNVAGMHIHVFTQMAGIFSNSTHWSSYSAYFVGDIAIKHISTVTLDQATLTLPINTIFQLNASIAPEDADVKDVVFTTSNPNIVAIVNGETGQIKSGTQNGSATITCTAADGTGYYAECVVTVSNQFVPASSITLNKQNATMNAGANLQLTATVYPTNASYRSATWESSDVTIATVNENGLVHAIKPGNVTITAQSTDGYVETTCEITVSYNTYTITDGTPYTNTKTESATTLYYIRTFDNTSWQALYVPFRMSYDDWKDNFYVAKLLNVHSYDKDDDGQVETLDIEIVRVTAGTLKENHPYLIRSKTTGEKTITINDATIYPAESNSIQCASTENTFDFTGAYEVTNVPYEGGYVLNSGELIKSGPTETINPYRFYMQITAKDGQLSTITGARLFETMEKTTYTVTLGTGGYGTYYGTYDTTLPSGMKAYIVTAKTDGGETGSLTYEKIADGDGDTKTVPSDVAVMLKADTGNSWDLELSPMDIDSRTFDTNLLHGSDKETTTTGGDVYYKLSYNTSGTNLGWYYGEVGGAAFTSGAYKAWLAVPESLSARAFGLPGDGTTGIETEWSMVNGEWSMADAWYSMDGHRLTGRPTKKGVYVHNGRKEVVR